VGCVFFVYVFSNGEMDGCVVIAYAPGLAGIRANPINQAIQAPWSI